MSDRKGPAKTTALPMASGLPVAGGLIVLSCALWMAMDSIAKHLGRDYPLGQIVWARYACSLVPMVIYAAAAGRMRSMWVTRRPDLQLARAALVLVSTFFVFGALKVIALAQVTAIIFISPIIVAVLGVAILGEAMTMRRWVAVILGFAGALLVIKPGFEGFHWALLIPLVAAFTRALYVLTTRALGTFDDPFTTLLYSGVIGTLVSSVTLVFDWRMPDPVGGGLLVLLGLFGAISHFMMIRAYAMAPSSTLAPFTYAEIAWSVLFGIVLFAEIPDVVTIVGVAVIIASGLLVLRAGR
ncbi:MAG: DMT family transporter [Alphaproteobacteria bacterium]|nr:DMT family transporter [Alphaproteobacteria bacterium]